MSVSVSTTGLTTTIRQLILSFIVVLPAKNPQQPASWGSLGPEAVSTVAKKLCNVKNFKNLTGSKDDPVECEDLTLLPTKYLLPLDWTQNQRLFAKGSGEYFFSKFNSTFVIHLFSAVTSKRKAHVGENSIYEIAAKTFCPITFKHATAESDVF
ncbi:uncharacterized protein LOC134784090 [Penaeus indicus]|uniref:uncharacterized protein LOC134784090 n=1 Tax=Penaeus indicus TaxID=29960 RepID=UPI00300DB9FD